MRKCEWHAVDAFMRRAKSRRSEGSIYSTGRVLYSFGSHFPLAVWLDADGYGMAWNADRYGPRTTSHQSAARCLLPEPLLELRTDEMCELARLVEDDPGARVHVVKRWSLTVDEALRALRARMTDERLPGTLKKLDKLEEDLRLERAVRRL